MKRIIGHWTAGGGRANDVDVSHYHRLVEYDGTIIPGKEDIADNVVTSDGDYAAHTRRLNTDSIGVAVCGMAGAKEYPFNAGSSPITEKQWRVFCIMIADLCRQYSIPVTRETVLTHAEVEPTLGVKQRGKWDISRLPFRADLVGAYPVGDYMRECVRQILGDDPVSDYEHRPFLKMGGNNPRAAVKELQEDLQLAGYHSGKIDGIFGRRTRTSVMAFQADNGLVPDGMVGTATWAAFDSADAVLERDIDVKELAKTSRTMQLATKGERALTTTEATLGTGVSIAGAVEIAKSAQQAEGALEIGQRILTEYWLPLVVVLGVVLASRYGKTMLRAIKENRVEDARLGKHLGR